MAMLLLALPVALHLSAVAPSSRARCVQMAAKELIIWDCDGCIVDSEAVRICTAPRPWMHLLTKSTRASICSRAQLLKTAEKEALHEAGFTQVTIDDCNRLFSGFAPEAGAANFLAEYGKPVPEDFFKKQIEGSAELFRTRLTQLNAKTILALAAAGHKQVVASGSPRDRVLVCLEVAGIDHLFTPEQVFTREDVPGRGKVRAMPPSLTMTMRVVVW